MSKYSILITGGAGFIGSHLVEYFLNEGNRVIVLDNLSTGTLENINDYLSNDNFKFIKGDIRNLDDCNQAVNSADFVLHQAALGSVPRSMEDPLTTNNVNITGFLNMLIAARDNKIKRFVYAASSSTYGDHPGLPKVEHKIGKPLSPYAVTKYVNELYADVFSKCYGLEIIGLRYFNVFGPRQNPNGAYAAVIPKFISNMIEGKKLIIHGDGKQSRDFTFVKNVVQINKLALQTKNIKALNQVYNVGCNEKLILNELVGNIKDILCSYSPNMGPVKVEYSPGRMGDVKHSLADISKANQLLGYNPIVNNIEGLEETIVWFLNRTQQLKTMNK